MIAPPPWLPAAPATHEALSTVLAAMGEHEGRREWSGARDLVLTWYLSALARSGPGTAPELFPTEADRLAYALNAHVAWAVALGEKPALRRKDVWALRQVSFPLDGATSTLAGLEAEVAALAPFEPRVVLLLNPGWRGGPPLPHGSIEARSLEFQIATQARVCGARDGFWQFDATRRIVAVSAFTDFMWELPTDRHERVRRLLELVPPPEHLAGEIVATCGATLLRCSIASAPFDTSRLIEPGRRR